MTNSKEKVRVEGGTVTFDWSTGTMTAHWDNGYTETWSLRGYSMKAKATTFFMFTEQYDRLQSVAV